MYFIGGIMKEKGEILDREREHLDENLARVCGEINDLKAKRAEHSDAIDRIEAISEEHDKEEQEILKMKNEEEALVLATSHVAKAKELYKQIDYHSDTIDELDAVLAEKREERNSLIKDLQAWGVKCNKYNQTLKEHNTSLKTVCFVMPISVSCAVVTDAVIYTKMQAAAYSTTAIAVAMTGAALVIGGITGVVLSVFDDIKSPESSSLNK
jgi:hypothetical protein